MYSQTSSGSRPTDEIVPPVPMTATRGMAFMIPSRNPRLRRSSMRRFFSVTAVLLVTALLVSPIGAQQKPLKRVSVQLGWIKNVQFGGLFVADQRGWFAQEGLDVTFIAGGAGIEPINSGASRSASARI